MRARRAGSLLAAVAFGIGLLTASVDALAEAVECPRCWRMIDEGPCRCPHCEERLPGRSCPPGDQESEASDDEPEASDDEPEASDDEPEARSDADRAEDEARPPPRRRPDERPERRRVRRRRPPPRERAEERRRPEPDERRRVRRRRRPPEERRRVRRRRRPPEERRRRRRPPEERRERPREERDDRSGQEQPAERGFAGPAFLIGYRYFGLQDWTGEGHAHALSIEGFPLRSIAPWFRLGIGLDTGFRLLERHTDWTMRGFLSLGVQYPWRVTPYGSLSIGGGMAYRKRFGQGMTDGLFGLGLDVGATFNITRTFVADIGLGYMYTSFDDLDYHGFTVRVALGW